MNIRANQDNFLITICITHFKDTDFVLNALYCLKCLTKNKYKVIIRDNNAPGPFYRRLEKAVKDYDNVELYRAENFKLKGSLAHGVALNDLLSRVNTPYAVFLDADCAFLMKNWDEILISRLNDKVKVIGTQAPEKKGLDFPFAVGILFETNVIKELDIDFRPVPSLRGQDTGWQMREKCQKAGFMGKIIEFKNTRFYKEGPFKDVLGVAEYYLDGDYEHVFASHFGRGSGGGGAKYKKGGCFVFKLFLLGDLLCRRKNKAEKKKWLARCRQIVNSQI